MMPSSRAFYAWLLIVSLGRLWHMVLARSPSFSMGLYHLLVVLSLQVATCTKTLTVFYFC